MISVLFFCSIKRNNKKTEGKTYSAIKTKEKSNRERWKDGKRK